jgi:murein DD-endopeptidase MepM/ murein hydrolase activator NlpD
MIKSIRRPRRRRIGYLLIPLAFAAALTRIVCADETIGEGVSGGAREPVGGSSLIEQLSPSLAEQARRQVHRRDLRIGAPNPDHDDDYLYRLPYGDSVSYSVLQGYGSRLSHRGSEYFTVDFRMAEGTLVQAAREGQVVHVEDSYSESCWAEGCEMFANFIVVLHSDGTTGEYFHLQQGSAMVEPGQTVARGQPLARSGNTGYSTTPHLHFGVYRAAGDGTSQSIGVRFLTRGGLVTEPRAGARYLNAAGRRPDRD